MATRRSRPTAGYIAVLTGCFALALVAGFTVAANRIDNYAYDLMFRFFPPPVDTSPVLVLAIDEATFAERGGVRKLRTILADALNALAANPPKAVAMDVILADPGDPAEDKLLAEAAARLPQMTLSCELVNGAWEDPLPALAKSAAALGHVHPDQNGDDGVVRQIPLEERSQPGAPQGRAGRRWALALETDRLWHRVPHILESPQDLQIGDTLIPADAASQRLIRIRYPQADLPTVSMLDLLHNPKLAAEWRDRAVFVGETAISAGDRKVSPFGEYLPGVKIHASAFATLAKGRFLVSASNSAVLGYCVLFGLVAGTVFWWRSGWVAYSMALGLLVLAHTLPVLYFRGDVIFPYFQPVSVAWLSVVGAASYQYFVVRRLLGKTEMERARYREAIHFVTHEMRTPLTAIQGSSELIGRYNLNEDKRRQIADMINSESKRLAKMIQTFLDVERLTDGQLELKQETFAASDIVHSCFDRVRPLADRKRIAIELEEPIEGQLRGDRELMEYAVYNLLTNAVKYSPSETRTVVSARRDGARLRLSVADQGIGMDARELKNIFTKFYRTKKAEASGEAGTGIGLSIVDQIVTRHGGRMEVTSEPGKGSCFTMVVPVEDGERKGQPLAS